MASLPPEMVNILSHVRYGELDEDLTGLHNINILSQQANDMLEAESTSHTERPFLTLLLRMVNQNASHGRQVEGLKHKVEELTSKNSSQLTTIMKCLTNPTIIEAADRLAAELSIEFSQLLARSKQVAPVTSLTVSVNVRGTVTVLYPSTVPISIYAHWFEAMTSIFNTKVETPQNPFLTFRSAPSDLDIAIHNVPLFALSKKKHCLRNSWKSSASLLVSPQSLSASSTKKTPPTTQKPPPQLSSLSPPPTLPLSVNSSISTPSPTTVQSCGPPPLPLNANAAGNFASPPKAAATSGKHVPYALKTPLAIPTAALSTHTQGFRNSLQTAVRA